MIQFRVTGRKARVGQKLTNIRNEFRGKFSKKLVDDAYDFAYSTAPHAKDRLGGGTKEALRIVKLKRDAKLELMQPRKRPGPYRPYHMWMHGYGRVNIAPYIYTGDPRFMETTFYHMVELSRKKMDKLKK